MSTPEAAETRPDRRFVPWYRRLIPSRRTVAVIVVLLLVAPVGIRWYRLWRMPDVPVPFDVDEFCQTPPDEENAFYFFRQAAARHKSTDFSKELEWSGPHGEVIWENVPDNVRTWAEQGQDTLKLFRQGARCSTACRIPPALYSGSSWYDPDLSSITDLYRLVLMDAVRLINREQTNEAAESLHDAFRATRHLGRHGDILDRIRGRNHFFMISNVWRQWSRHPHVTADDIDTALARIRDDWKLTPPVSDQYKMEYLGDLHIVNSSLIENRQVLDNWLDDQVLALSRNQGDPFFWQFDEYIPGWQVPWLWMLGEPEMTARATRLKLTHLLKYCDLHCADLPPLMDGPYRETAEPTGGLTPRELNQRFHQSMLSPSVNNTFTPEDYLAAIRHETARQTLLETELMLQAQFRRWNVASRAEAERLVTDFSWPVDPCSAERRPIRFRAADEGLVLWSVGPDGIDQDGEVVDSGPIEDVVVVIPWRTIESN